MLYHPRSPRHPIGSVAAFNLMNKFRVEERVRTQKKEQTVSSKGNECTQLVSHLIFSGCPVRSKVSFVLTLLISPSSARDLLCKVE